MAPREDDDFSRPVLMDWPSFHARGLELARRLKGEVGEVRVIYSKPIEDPPHAEHEHVEIMADGATRALPHWLGVPFRLCDRIVSGGQTGVDRAALDFAMEAGYSHGGWCPKGRKAEDGRIPTHYNLAETESEGYRQRTKRNVLESDGTLILNSGELGGGTLETLRIARRAGRPVHVVTLDSSVPEDEIRRVLEWLEASAPMAILNVAGPKEGKRPGIYRQSLEFLRAVVAWPFPLDA